MNRRPSGCASSSGACSSGGCGGCPTPPAPLISLLFLPCAPQCSAPRLPRTWTSWASAGWRRKAGSASCACSAWPERRQARPAVPGQSAAAWAARGLTRARTLKGRVLLTLAGGARSVLVCSALKTVVPGAWRAPVPGDGFPSPRHALWRCGAGRMRCTECMTSMSEHKHIYQLHERFPDAFLALSTCRCITLPCCWCQWHSHLCHLSALAGQFWNPQRTYLRRCPPPKPSRIRRGR